MKKLFCLMLSATFIVAQAFAKIPAKVTDAFWAKYNGASNVQWKHGLSKYRADFNMGQYQLQAKFDKHGNWLEAEKKLKKDKLPMMVKNSLKKSKYNQWEIKSSYEEYLPNEQPHYRIMAAKGDFKRKSLVFNHRGELVKG